MGKPRNPGKGQTKTSRNGEGKGSWLGTDVLSNNHSNKVEFNVKVLNFTLGGGKNKKSTAAPLSEIQSLNAQDRNRLEMTLNAQMEQLPENIRRQVKIEVGKRAEEFERRVASGASPKEVLEAQA